MKTQLKVESWAVGVTTCDKRPQSTLQKTLESLEKAGWKNYRVFHDNGRGAWRHWIFTLNSLVKDNPNVDAYFILQDDVVFCKGLREYMERILWPKSERIAFCSPYTPTPYRTSTVGLNSFNAGENLCCAQSFIIPNETAKSILEDLGDLQAEKRIDMHVGRWALATNHTSWFHVPSLAQHLADDNSTLGNFSIPELRMASDFLGESFDVSCYFSE